MKPKISTKYNFDYDDMISSAKYAFVYHRCGNQGNESRPCVVTGENKKLNKCIGFEISIYNDGIEQNAEFSIPKDWIDYETLTVDANQLICDWLIKQGQSSLITR